MVHERERLATPTRSEPLTRGLRHIAANFQD